MKIVDFVRDLVASSDAAQQANRGAPAAAGALLTALTLNQWVGIVTIAYVVFQFAYLARKWWREEHAK